MMNYSNKIQSANNQVTLNDNSEIISAIAAILQSLKQMGITVPVEIVDASVQPVVTEQIDLNSSKEEPHLSETIEVALEAVKNEPIPSLNWNNLSRLINYKTFKLESESSFTNSMGRKVPNDYGQIMKAAIKQFEIDTSLNSPDLGIVSWTNFCPSYPIIFSMFDDHTFWNNVNRALWLNAANTTNTFTGNSSNEIIEALARTMTSPLKLAKMEQYLFDHVPSIRLAGGSVANILLALNGPSMKEDSRYVDKDFFFVGCKTDQELLGDVSRAIEWFYIFLAGKMRLYITGSVITIVEDLPVPESKENVGSLEELYPRTYQLMLRRYHSDNQVLAGFDLNPCMFMFDGYRFLTNRSGLLTMTYRVMLIHPKTYYYSFEKRIVKYVDRYGLKLYIWYLDTQKVKGSFPCDDEYCSSPCDHYRKIRLGGLILDPIKIDSLGRMFFDIKVRCKKRDDWESSYQPNRLDYTYPNSIVGYNWTALAMKSVIPKYKIYNVGHIVIPKLTFFEFVELKEPLIKLSVGQSFETYLKDSVKRLTDMSRVTPNKCSQYQIKQKWITHKLHDCQVCKDCHLYNDDRHEYILTKQLFPTKYIAGRNPNKSTLDIKQFVSICTNYYIDTIYPTSCNNPVNLRVEQYNQGTSLDNEDPNRGRSIEKWASCWLANGYSNNLSQDSASFCVANPDTSY